MNALWQYYAPAGWATQWWYPEGVHGKLFNLFHNWSWAIW